MSTQRPLSDRRSTNGYQPTSLRPAPTGRLISVCQERVGARSNCRPLCLSQIGKPSALFPSPKTASAAAAGFSLIEVMVVMTVIAILVTLAVPHYDRALEQSRANIAAANLWAIWSAERLYWLENGTYSANLTALQAAGLLDPQIVLATSGYVYQVTAADSNTLTADATRVGSTSWSGAYQIDETGLVSGSIRAAGHLPIVPGLQ